MDRGETTVGEGVTLRWLRAGSGPDLVLLPGWSQTAAMFDRQLVGLSASHRVTAVDPRGHGESDTPEIGYHVHRLAADLYELLELEGMDDVCLLAHSAGCAVAWAYLELLGDAHLAGLVLVDQMPCALRDPSWDDATAAQAGASMEPAALFEFLGAMRSDGPDPRIDFVHGVTSDGIDPADLDRIVEQNQTFDRHRAADLIYDVATHDWRRHMAEIGLPTLVISGDSPNVPEPSQRWISEQVPGARYQVVEGATGGTHYPFIESADDFNAAVAGFLADLPT